MNIGMANGNNRNMSMAMVSNARDKQNEQIVTHIEKSSLFDCHWICRGVCVCHFSTFLPPLDSNRSHSLHHCCNQRMAAEDRQQADVRRAGVWQPPSGLK